MIKNITCKVKFRWCFCLLEDGFFCLLLLFFPFIFISWRLITLQYCSGFCHTLTWTSHGFTCIPHPDPPSRLPLHPIPLGLPSAPGPSTCLISLDFKSGSYLSVKMGGGWRMNQDKSHNECGCVEQVRSAGRREHLNIMEASSGSKDGFTIEAHDNSSCRSSGRPER